MPAESWTREQIELLRQLWNEGLTAAAIAARLGGLSRSAVLGKVHRLRLRTDKAAAASAVKAKSAAERCAETAPARRRRGGKRGKHPQAAPAAVRQHKTLFELTNKTCRWIVEATSSGQWRGPGRTCTERHGHGGPPTKNAGGWAIRLKASQPPANKFRPRPVPNVSPCSAALDGTGLNPKQNIKVNQ